MQALPKRMKFIQILQPGGSESLSVQEGPVPEIGAREVLIQVAAAGLNRADLLQRQGRYPPPPGAPTTLGLEVAGTIVAIGAEVRDVQLGDRVCALVAGGGYAQYCAADAGQVLPIPESLNAIEAASLPEAYFTVWSNVFGFGRLAGGDTLLVHGGASGIGVAAIQLASVLGHRVYATAGSDARCRFCEGLGAARAIDYKREDFVREIAELTEGRGVDVVLDMVGGSYVARNLKVLATEGRLVMISAQGGVKGEVDVLRIMQRRLVLTGSTLRGRSADFKRQIKEQLERRVWPLIAQGKVKPIVDRTFPFEQSAAAHAYMESGAHKGKIVLQVDA